MCKKHLDKSVTPQQWRERKSVSHVEGEDNEKPDIKTVIPSPCNAKRYQILQETQNE